MDDEENPFRLPPDDEIFLMRERERNQRAEERARIKQLRVWEKTTSSSRINRIKRFQDSDVPSNGGPGMRKSTSLPSLEKLNPRREKENITDFISKKREMFLVQMSLEVKREEIKKLDEKSKMKEDALKKSQAMLDEDVTRFDTFLQANDAKAHKAMKQAEDMIKKKQEKMQKIKMLKDEISQKQSEISKHKEAREECYKYKKFLLSLTPQEWKDAKKLEKIERRRLRKQKWIQDQLLAIEDLVKTNVAVEEKVVEEKEAEMAKRRRRNKRDEEEYQKQKELDKVNRRNRIRAKYPTEEQVEADYEEVSSGQETPLYFREPQQLFDIFTALEESNLFLIQNSQETEQALEEVQQKFAETQRVMGAEADKIKAQLDQLESQIGTENAMCEYLNSTVAQKKGSGDRDALLDELSTKVVEVHAVCGFDTDHDPNTLQMLSEIEKKLEELLSQLDEAENNPAQERRYHELQKQKEAERRERVKERKRIALEKKTEDRLKASLLRSQAPVHKKTGKQIMFRSAPLHMAKKVIKVDEAYEEAKIDYGVFGIHFQHGIPEADEPVADPT